MLLEERKVYKHDWPAYNLAQATEKRRLQVLLNDLCRNLPERDCSKKRGPKPHLVKDSVFAMAFKVYCGLSSRRFSTDLWEAHEKGYISKPSPGAKVTAFFENQEFTPILKNLIGQSARPLRAVEHDFAIDSSGFGSTRYEPLKVRSKNYWQIMRNRSVYGSRPALCDRGETNVVTASPHP